MGLDYFGFRIVKQSDEERKLHNNLVAPVDTDGAQIIEVGRGGGAQYATYSGIDFSISNERQLINKYRQLSLVSEVESAIDEIINEAITTGDQQSPVQIRMDRVQFSDNIKQKIREEFESALIMLNFPNNAYEIFKRWYVDGRLYYQVVINKTDPRKGIQALSYIDPREITKVREVRREPNQNGVEVVTGIKEYYVYRTESSQTINLPVDSVAEATSGLIEQKGDKQIILSYLHKAIKPLNQLNALEDATVIYRLARAPERRVFYVDVGNLPKLKAEQYVEGLMNKYRNKIIYDSSTGEINDDRRTMAMLEDFWMPRREGGRGTQIDVLAGGQNLGELEDVNYFQRKLYKALNVPIGRVSADDTLSSGRATEISREEIKFFKFVQRLRQRFTNLFDEILGRQLVLKNIVTEQEWEDDIKPYLFYDFKTDSHFMEFNDAEIWTRRMEVAQTAVSLGKKFFSDNYIRKKILKQTEEEIAQIAIDNGVAPADEEQGDAPTFGPSGGTTVNVGSPNEPLEISREGEEEELPGEEDTGEELPGEEEGVNPEEPPEELIPPTP